MLKKKLKQFFSFIRYRRRCHFDFGAIALGTCKFEGSNKICRGAYVKNLSIGYGSSVGSNSYLHNVTIGRYTSVGDNVVVVSATHPMEPFASTHPAFYRENSRERFVGADRFCEYLTCDNGIAVEIGNDVWIGSHVLIKGGLKIGDGAVVAMGAVVTKDVEPYSIVGGVPARVIRYRFEKEQRDILLEKKWWNKSLIWIRENAESFADVTNLIELLTFEK